MNVQHVGYARKSRKGRALKLDLSLQEFLTATRYTGKDGEEYVGLLINMSKLLDVLEGRKEVTNVTQIGNDNGDEMRKTEKSRANQEGNMKGG